MPATPNLDARLAQVEDRSWALRRLGMLQGELGLSDDYGSVLLTLQDVIQKRYLPTLEDAFPGQGTRRDVLVAAWQATPVAERATWDTLKNTPDALGRILTGLQADAPVAWIT